MVFDKTGTLTLPEPRVANARRRSIRRCWNWPRGSRCRAAIRSRPRLRARRASRSPVRRRDRGAGPGRSRDDRWRRSAPRQSGVLRHRQHGSRARRVPDASIIAFSHGGRSAVLAVRQTLRPDAAATVAALRALGLDLHHPVGRPRRTPSRRSPRALGIADWRGGADAGRQDRRASSAEGAGPPRADGRRRPQRRAGACRRACLALADQRRRHHAGAGRRGVPRREARAGARCRRALRGGRAR